MGDDSQRQPIFTKFLTVWSLELTKPSPRKSLLKIWQFKLPVKNNEVHDRSSISDHQQYL